MPLVTAVRNESTGRAVRDSPSGRQVANTFTPDVFNLQRPLGDPISIGWSYDSQTTGRWRIHVDSATNILATGVQFEFFFDQVLVKLRHDGTVVWTKHKDDADMDGWCWSVTTDSLNNVYASMLHQTLTFQPNIRKYNPLGVQQWESHVGLGDNVPFDMMIASDGYLYIASHLIRKVDKDTGLQEGLPFPPPDSSATGGGIRITEGPDFFYTCGTSSGTACVWAWNKVTHLQEFQWEPAPGIDMFGLYVDSNGIVYVTGDTSGGVNVWKLNSTLTTVLDSVACGTGRGYGISVERPSNSVVWVATENSGTPAIVWELNSSLTIVRNWLPDVAEPATDIIQSSLLGDRIVVATDGTWLQIP